MRKKTQSFHCIFLSRYTPLQLIGQNFPWQPEVPTLIFSLCTVDHLCPPSSELSSCARKKTANLKWITHSPAFTQMTDRAPDCGYGTWKRRTLVHQHQVNCSLNKTGQQKPYASWPRRNNGICSTLSSIFHWLHQHHRGEHNGGKFSITWQGRGDSCCNWQACFPVEVLVLSAGCGSSVFAFKAEDFYSLFEINTFLSVVLNITQ